MRELIFADGDEFRAEGEDVGTLSDGIHGEAEGVIVAEAFVADFIFDGGVFHHAVETG